MTRARSAFAVSLLATLAASLIGWASPAIGEESADASASAPATDAAAAPAAAIPNEKCFKCHDDAEYESDSGAPIAVIAADYGAGAHKRLDCVQCHTDALTTKHPRNNLGKVTFEPCVECHEDEITPFKDSVHARVKGGEPATCQGCHGSVHTTPRSNKPNAPMSAVNQLRNCGQCHEKMMQGYLGSVHARALLVSGLNSAPAWQHWRL